MEKGLIRPEVMRFAWMMEHKLREHDDKGGWSRCKQSWLFLRITEEQAELTQAYSDYRKETTFENKLKMQGEAIDVANFLMMFLNNYKLL